MCALLGISLELVKEWGLKLLEVDQEQNVEVHKARRKQKIMGFTRCGSGF